MAALRIRSMLILFVDIVMAVIAFFLGMRVIFQLFQANPATPFVAWIYSVSGALMYPFRAIFPNIQVSDVGVIDLVALVTLLAYTIIGYIVIGLLRSLIHPREHLSTHHEHGVI
jgi:uncharacterized protein YggT (Ycf19 family)